MKRNTVWVLFRVDYPVRGGQVNILYVTSKKAWQKRKGFKHTLTRRTYTYITESTDKAVLEKMKDLSKE